MKHFLKTLIIFTGMIIFGLIGVFLVSYYEKSDEATPATSGLAN